MIENRKKLFERIKEKETLERKFDMTKPITKRNTETEWDEQGNSERKCVTVHKDTLNTLKPIHKNNSIEGNIKNEIKCTNLPIVARISAFEGFLEMSGSQDRSHRHLPPTEGTRGRSVGDKDGGNGDEMNPTNLAGTQKIS